MNFQETRTVENRVPRNSEYQNQKALFDIVRLRAKTSAAWSCVFAIPNGELRDKGTARKLFASGVKAGVWDICVPVQTAEYAGLWVEMKYAKNKLSAAQVKFQETVNAANVSGKPFLWKVCYTHKEAYETINDFLKGQKQ